MFARVTQGKKLLTYKHSLFQLLCMGDVLPIVLGAGNVYHFRIKPCHFGYLYVKRGLLATNEFDDIVFNFLKERIFTTNQKRHCLIFPKAEQNIQTPGYVRIRFFVSHLEEDNDVVMAVKKAVKDLFNDYIVFELQKEASESFSDTNRNDLCIKIWRYEDAPKEYRDFEHDDVDWIAYIPNEILRKEDNYIPFLEEGTPFGCCTVKKFKVDGGEVWIGCHA